jgi:hypothetical protein
LKVVTIRAVESTTSQTALAEYDVNQGRVADIKKGRMFPDSFAVAIGRARNVS